jgi:phosphoribosylformylglycinamidine synthase subunit PurQ / glutaminase
MKVGVVVFPGSNCDHDMIYVLKNILKQEVAILWHKEKDLQNCDFIVLPGGFSYGDYLRSGAIARFSPIMEEVMRYAENGGYVLGICNGFQILCEAHLLPGALLHNLHQKFICRNTCIKSSSASSLPVQGYPEGTVLRIPIAHGEGRFFADEKTLSELNQNGQVLFRYCDKNGNISPESNPNGSIENIAGICNKAGNVFGMMPHPERAADKELGNMDGLAILNSILNNIPKKALA